MSANIIIQEGGIARQFTVDKIKTNQVGGGTCLWVPPDTPHVGEKNITHNGFYSAADDGYAGYDRVNVNVTSITGRDGDGNEVQATVDPETGEITETTLPSYISIYTLPDQLSYFEGRAINYTNMVVKAYLKSGNLWTDASHPNGIISQAELTLPVQTADSSSMEPGGGEAISSLETALTQPIPFGTSGYTLQEINGDKYVYTTSGSSEVRVLRLIRTNGNTAPYFMSDKNFTVTGYRYDKTGALKSTNTYTPSRRMLYGYEGYVLSLPGTPINRTVSNGTVNINTDASMTDADYYTIIYGTIISGYKVPVRWSRGDGNVLEDSFNISILPNGTN